jgi:hypothetical protein
MRFARSAAFTAAVAILTVPALAQTMPGAMNGATNAMSGAASNAMGSGDAMKGGMMNSMKGAVKVTFTAQNNSGETGTGYLTPDGDKTKVMIALKGAPADAQPAHIHEGTCAKLNPKPTYPLSSVVDGKSNTEVDVPLSKLTAGTYAINVHKSPTDIATYVSCADITVHKGSM